MKKALIGFGLLLLFTLDRSVVSVEGVADRIVAVVNQEIITLSELEKWVEPLQKEITSEDRLHRKEQLQEFRRKILEQLIDEKLIDQEVKKLGIQVTSKEMDGVVFAIECPAHIAGAPNIMLTTVFKGKHPAPAVEAGKENRCMFEPFCLSVTVISQEHDVILEGALLTE